MGTLMSVGLVVVVVLARFGVGAQQTPTSDLGPAGSEQADRGPGRVGLVPRSVTQGWPAVALRLLVAVAVVVTVRMVFADSETVTGVVWTLPAVTGAWG